MPPFVAGRKPHWRSNQSTPGPGEAGPSLAERLSYTDLPRPFRNPNFQSKLHLRTATSLGANRKNVKQILNLERERVSGGDGFLTAAQVAAKARGEVLEVGSKKKKSGPDGIKRPVGWNLKNRNLSRGGRGGGRGTPATNAGSGSGVSTPLGTSPPASGGTPAGEEEEDEDMGEGEKPAEEVIFRKDVMTYHTPAAPPSLLPAKKYCDITGLHAGYTDPRTKLRYQGLQVWHVVRSLGPGGDQAYLSLRNAQTALK